MNHATSAGGRQICRYPPEDWGASRGTLDAVCARQNSSRSPNWHLRPKTPRSPFRETAQGRLGLSEAALVVAVTL